MIVEPPSDLDAAAALSLLRHENAYLRARLAEQQREDVGWLALDVTGQRYQRQQQELVRLRRELRELHSHSGQVAPGHTEPQSQ